MVSLVLDSVSHDYRDDNFSGQIFDEIIFAGSSNVTYQFSPDQFATSFTSNVRWVNQNTFPVGVVVSIDVASYFDASAWTFSGTFSGTQFQFVGSAGVDYLVGSVRFDNLLGGEGDDTLRGGGSLDKLDGQGGDDHFIWLKGDSSDTVIGGSGFDTQTIVTGNSGADTFDLTNIGSGATKVTHTGGSDYNLTLTTVEKLEIFAGAGANTINVVDSLTNTAFANGGISFEGGAQSDTINAAISGVIIVASGFGGIDNFTGGALGDRLDGGTGNDVLNGGLGNDTLIGGAGSDTINGGGGTDAASYSGASASVSVNLALGVGSDGDAQGDILDGIENLIGSFFSDTLTGDGRANTLSGGSGADKLNGGSENDRLTGGLDKDFLTGGSGADLFIYTALSDSTSASSGRDTIADFTRGNGDKIDLSAIDARSSISGNQTFKFIGNDSFNDVAGELRYTQTGGKTYIQADVDGNGASDLIIQFDLSRTFIATDFVL